MKTKTENNTVDMASSKMKVLGLQELSEVAGGRAAQAQDWSTSSNDCGGVDSDEWSTMSNGCRDEKIALVAR